MTINEDFRYSLGKMIVSAREEQGITQKELSSRCGIPQPNLSLIESGKANPSINTVTKIIDALDRRLMMYLVYDEKEDDAYDR